MIGNDVHKSTQANTWISDPRLMKFRPYIEANMALEWKCIRCYQSCLKLSCKFVTLSKGYLGFRLRPIWSYGENVLNFTSTEKIVTSVYCDNSVYALILILMLEQISRSINRNFILLRWPIRQMGLLFKMYQGIWLRYPWRKVWWTTIYSV